MHHAKFSPSSMKRVIECPAIAGMSFEHAITVTVERRDGDVEVHGFDSARAASNFCNEEVKWESTQRVVCDDIEFDQRGDFATK